MPSLKTLAKPVTTTSASSVSGLASFSGFIGWPVAALIESTSAAVIFWKTACIAGSE